VILKNWFLRARVRKVDANTWTFAQLVGSLKTTGR